MEKEISKRFLKGIPASPGIVMGRACVFQDILYLVERRSLEEGDAESEIARLKQAVRQVRDELIQDQLRVSREIGKREAEIFLAHVASRKTLILSRRGARKKVRRRELWRKSFASMMI
jgi:phosphoenolpyruvate-protein kinase (PTS system EI component)